YSALVSPLQSTIAILRVLPEAKAELLKVTEIINARKIEQIAIFFMVHFPFLPKPSTGGLMFTPSP
ncbi:MAG: hypothetical protein MUO68_11615, partial [Desulfobacteraceae bacterium]|nr:hypothetical protein [Desulfobacteraceae bacterium]